MEFTVFHSGWVYITRNSGTLIIRIIKEGKNKFYGITRNFHVAELLWLFIIICHLGLERIDIINLQENNYFLYLVQFILHWKNFQWNFHAAEEHLWLFITVCHLGLERINIINLEESNYFLYFAKLTLHWKHFQWNFHAVEELLWLFIIVCHLGLGSKGHYALEVHDAISWKIGLVSI